MFVCTDSTGNLPLLLELLGLQLDDCDELDENDADDEEDDEDELEEDEDLLRLRFRFLFSRPEKKNKRHGVWKKVVYIK